MMFQQLPDYMKGQGSDHSIAKEPQLFPKSTASH